MDTIPLFPMYMFSANALAAEQAFLSTPEVDLTFQMLISPSDPFAAATGVSEFSGMTVGTLFTLFVVPALYMLIAKQHQGKQNNVD